MQAGRRTGGLRLRGSCGTNDGRQGVGRDDPPRAQHPLGTTCRCWVPKSFVLATRRLTSGWPPVLSSRQSLHTQRPGRLSAIQCRTRVSKQHTGSPRVRQHNHFAGRFAGSSHFARHFAGSPTNPLRLYTHRGCTPSRFGTAPPMRRLLQHPAEIGRRTCLAARSRCTQSRRPGSPGPA